MLYFGIDIGGTAVKYGLVTKQGELLSSCEYPVAFDQYKTPILDTVQKTSRQFLNEHLKDKDVLKGIGVSATGQIDTKYGVVAGGNIASWTGTKLKNALENQYKVPVTVVNDANCAVLAEKWVGTAKNYSDVIMITIGTGIGGGVIINNQLLTGGFGYAGELGHFSVEKDGIPCVCGNKGCYEKYASMTALVQKVKEQKEFIDMGEIKEQEICGRIIFDMIKNNNKTVMKLADEWMEWISCGLVSLVHIFNPQLIVIGGGVSRQEELFIQKIREKIMSRTMKNFGRGLEIKSAAMGNQAGLIGAVYYFIQKYYKNSL